MKDYKSHAHWTKIGESQDPHPDYEFCRSIALALVTRWGISSKPCEVRGYCIKAWVTNKNGDILVEYGPSIEEIKKINEASYKENKQLITAMKK